MMCVHAILGGRLQRGASRDTRWQSACNSLNAQIQGHMRTNIEHASYDHVQQVITLLTGTNLQLDTRDCPWDFGSMQHAVDFDDTRNMVLGNMRSLCQSTHAKLETCGRPACIP